MIKVGDKVKVLDQEIFGVVLRISDFTNEVIIRDEDSEFESPEDELIYKFSELEIL